MTAFIECRAFFEDRGEKHVVLTEAFPYFVRLSDDQVQGKAAVYTSRNIERLFDIAFVMWHNDQQVDIAIIRGGAAGIGAEEDNLIRREFVRNPLCKIPNDTPTNHVESVLPSTHTGKDFCLVSLTRW